MKLSVFVFCLLHLGFSTHTENSPVLPNPEHHSSPHNTGNKPKTEQLPPLSEVFSQNPPRSQPGDDPNASRSHHQLPPVPRLLHPTISPSTTTSHPQQPPIHNNLQVPNRPLTTLGLGNGKFLRPIGHAGRHYSALTRYNPKRLSDAKHYRIQPCFRRLRHLIAGF